LPGIIARFFPDALSIEQQTVDGKCFNPLSFLQNCLRLADVRQGTTSVVPQKAHSGSGFSRCGIANNLKKETQGLKPNIFLLN
jgi:hypothetical protein